MIPNANRCAFPATAEQSSGLTKREHFAGLAMQGLLANPQTIDDAAAVIRASVCAADDLIAHLDKPT